MWDLLGDETGQWKRELWRGSTLFKFDLYIPNFVFSRVYTSKQYPHANISRMQKCLSNVVNAIINPFTQQFTNSPHLYPKKGVRLLGFITQRFSLYIYNVVSPMPSTIPKFEVYGIGYAVETGMMFITTKSWLVNGLVFDGFTPLHCQS